MIKIVYPEHGRGNWSTGMLNLNGTDDGPFYRAPADSSVKMIGADVAAKAASSQNHRVSINEYAVWRGAWEIQSELKRQGYDIEVDGVWGPATDAVVKMWQRKEKIAADGIYGPQTARNMWEPLLANEVAKANAFMDHLNAQVFQQARGHIRVETNWDIAAVGYQVSKDLGVAQINQDAHGDDFTVDESFNPRKALNFALGFIIGNLNWSGWNLDDAIACYNVGRSGAQDWVNAGRPEDWAAAEYVKAVKDQM